MDLGIAQRGHLQTVLRWRWLGYAASLAAVALISALISLVLRQRPVANASMVYLIAVLAIAVRFGRGPAVLASAAAFLTFNWLFVEPLHTFAIADPAQWIALLLFLLTAIITGQLAAGLRQRAEVAQQREREATVLYDVVGLMSEPALDRALEAVAGRLRQELGLAAVAIELADEKGTTARASLGDEDAVALIRRAAEPAVQVLAGRTAPTAGCRGRPGRWVRIVPPHSLSASRAPGGERLRAIPVKVHGRPVGRLVLVHRPGALAFSLADDRLLSAAATQLGIAFERVLLRGEATEAEILRRTDALRSALLNAVSHDLRTPLASIIASAASLRQRDVRWTEEEQREFAEAIEQEALRLNQIVGNLLDLSRIEAGSLRPEKDWYDLSALVDEVLGRLRPLTLSHRMSVNVPEDLPPVLLDYVEIDQVLSNLIENATKYTKPGTEIEVSARRSGGEVQIAVTDHGPGIPPTALQHLFESFYRADSRGPRPKGTGFGLAVAKGLVEAHGGRIQAMNRPEGGARFVFTLPLDHRAQRTLASEESKS